MMTTGLARWSWESTTQPSANSRKPPQCGRAIVIGNGSSVDDIPPATWGAWANDDDLCIIATNRALAFAALQGIRIDVAVMRDSPSDLWQNVGLCKRYHSEIWMPFSGWKVGPANQRVAKCDEYLRFLPGWQTSTERDNNRECAVMEQATVALMAANWAWLNGARTIGIIGSDYCGGYASMIPPYQGMDVFRIGQYERPMPDLIERQYASARKSIELLGGRILNLSKKSLITTMEKQDVNATENNPFCLDRQ